MPTSCKSYKLTDNPYIDIIAQYLRICAAKYAKSAYAIWPRLELWQRVLLLIGFAVLREIYEGFT